MGKWKRKYSKELKVEPLERVLAGRSAYFTLVVSRSNHR